MDQPIPPSLIGASVRRREDQRFLTGLGNYTDDFNRHGQTHAYILRSSHPHALIKSISTVAAKKAPGVVAVFTGADMAASGVGSLPCGWQIHSKDGTPMVEPGHPPLVVDRVRHVGDNVAVVLAETLEQAKDAAELIEIEWQTLPSLSSTADAVKPTAPQVWEQAPGNLCYDWHIGDKDAVDAAFAKAHKVAKIDLVNNRLIPNAMEPRAALGDYDRGTGEHTLITTSQNPHVIRLLMGAYVLQVPESKLRVIAPDVGGGFGSKIYHYAEEAIVTWAAKQIGRPVKWTAERTESFMTDAHGRDHVSHAEMALDEQGHFLALRVATIANMGAYLSTFAPAIPTYLYATLLAGVYKTPVIYAEVKAVFTHTTPVDAYRGAGRPEATFLLERLVDVAAGVMGLTPAEIRKRNFIPADAFPYQTPVALQYDSGDYQGSMAQAETAADIAGFPARKAESAKHGKLRGIGYSTYVEACGIAPSAVAGALGARAGLYEVGTIRVHPTGTVTVLTGAHSHGQGHETTFAQVVAQSLGIGIEQVEIVHGDTGQVPFGMGTYGSRSLAVGGSAIIKAIDKIVAKGKKIAAHLLEAAEADIEFQDGKFSVAGTDRSKSFGEIALAAYVPHNYPIETVEPGLDETAFYDPKNFTFPAGVHICEVEIDPETGVTKVEKFTVVDDVGRVINPMIVDGQVHGGVAQGIGQALMENCVYDEVGQLLSGSFMDYCMPRADDLPNFGVSQHTTLCTHNPLGVKGCGEVGAIGSPPAVINAVVDALKPYGITHFDMPASPQRVWKVINAHTPRMAAE